MKSVKKLIYLMLAVFVISVACPNIIPFVNSPTKVEAAVKLSKKTAVILKGKTVTLKVKGTKKKSKWSTSNKSVATVNSKGKVSGKKAGVATITASIGSKKYSCKVTVESPSISSKKASVYIGSKVTLKMNGTTQKVKWKTSKKSVATVNSKGVVTGKKKGTATITATVLGKKYTCKVTVNKKPKTINVTSFSLNTHSIILKEGEYQNIGSYIYPSNATNKKITWSSSNTNVARVDLNGKVTAVSPGSAIITAKCGGKTDTCDVSVSINFNSNEAISKMYVNSYPVEDGVIVTIKNNYKYPVDLNMDCIYYNSNGNMIGKNSDYQYALEPGRECALFAYNPYDSNYKDVNYSSYSIRLSASEASNVVCNAKNILCVANYGADNVMVNVRNNGERVEFTKIAIVFYKNGYPIGYDERYADVDNIGISDVLQFSFPYDSNYDTIIPDNFKIYVNSSYRYSWS